jgi:hypothetical protein
MAQSESLEARTRLAAYLSTGLARLNNGFSRRAPLYVTLFLLICFIGLLAKAQRLPMWLDEVYTLNVVNQPSFGGVIDATRDGADGMPPLYALVVRAIRPLLGSDHVALRLPSLIGYLVMCACAFAFFWRRLPAIYCAVAMFIAAVACRYYATEARPYGLILGMVGVALLAYQRAAETKPRIWALLCLVLSLSVAIALHSFSVFSLAAFGAAEVVRSFQNRKIDTTLAGAVVLPVFAVLLHVPMLQSAHRFAAHSWSKASLGAIPDFYTDSFVLLLPAAFAAMFLYVLWQLSTGWVDVNQGDPPASIRDHEIVLCAVLAALPVVADLIAIATVGAFVTRYTISAVIGTGLLFAALLYRATRASVAAAGSVVVALSAVMTLAVMSPLLRAPQRGEAKDTLRLLKKLPPDPKPILFGNHRPMFELWYYADPAVQQRLTYPVDERSTLAYVGADSSVLLITALGRYMPALQAPDWQAFLATHRRFFLVSNGDNWVTWNLLKLGYQVRPYSGAPAKMLNRPGIFIVDPPDTNATR